MSIALLSIVELASVLCCLYQQILAASSQGSPVDREALSDMRFVLNAQPELVEDVQREWLTELQSTGGVTAKQLADALAWFNHALLRPQVT